MSTFNNGTTTVATGNTPKLNFDADQFALRRSNAGAGNPYDYNSLLTGEEIELGFDYDKSHREFADPQEEVAASYGHRTTEQILAAGPRVFNVVASITDIPAILAEGAADVSETDVLEAFSD